MISIIKKIFLKIEILYNKKKNDYLFAKKSVLVDTEKKIYYIIRRKYPGAGFFSNYLYVLGHIVYAVEKGYEPIVDFKNYKMLYSSARFRDSWYSFFVKQASCKENLKDVYRRGNYILSDDNYLFEYSERQCGMYGVPSLNAVDFYSEYIQKYCKMREEYLNIFDQYIQENFKGKVLGVHIRGTDMKTAGGGHPHPASENTFVQKIEEIKKDNQIDTIFVATDEKKNIDIIKKSFPNEKVIYTDAVRADENDTRGIHNININRKKDGHSLGLEVLKDMYLLSKCDYLVCGYSNVTNVAILNNQNNYEKMIIVQREYN